MQDRRHYYRTVYTHQVKCRLGPNLFAYVEMSDISCGGCKIRTTRRDIQIGQSLVLKFPGLEGLAGKVSWKLGTDLGVKFEQPLHPAVARHHFPRSLDQYGLETFALS
ncbi:PilZ domain-containing protein [Novosphingobium marinum]|uniref:PilZ domain-containing protein n=1 Tax=Novosphingobium marinum TaxID=1514948 RepID=UPI0015C7DBBE|nr:PilZ domain-containing protein [Novosphingobium marinum]